MTDKEQIIEVPVQKDEDQLEMVLEVPKNKEEELLEE